MDAQIIPEKAILFLGSPKFRRFEINDWKKETQNHTKNGCIEAALLLASCDPWGLVIPFSSAERECSRSRASLVWTADSRSFDENLRYCVMALMKFIPFGVPTPVTLSQPGVTLSDESVPKVSTNH
jgi:hypothetical protein